MANQFLSLSLFLMLLSFFIVMNSVSDFEEYKARPVMNSLLSAFSNDVVVSPPPTPVDPGQIMESNKKGDTLEALEGLFNAHVSGFEVKKNRLGTVMHVRVPVGRFENALDFSSLDVPDIAFGTRGAFLPTLVSLMRSEVNGIPMRVEMILNTQGEPDELLKNDPSGFASSLRRVSGFAQKLERSGLPRKMMSAGLGAGDPSKIDLFFHRYKVINIAEALEDQERK